MSEQDIREFEQLVARFDRAAYLAPHTFDTALERSARTYALPLAQMLAPRGRTGRLRGSLTIRRRVAGVVFYSAVEYANTMQWGRKTLPTQRSPKMPKHPNVVEGKEFVTRALGITSDRREKFMLQAIDRILT